MGKLGKESRSLGEDEGGRASHLHTQGKNMTLGHSRAFELGRELDIGAVDGPLYTCMCSLSGDWVDFGWKFELAAMGVVLCVII